MIGNEPTPALNGLVPMKRLFRVTSPMRLNETSSPMKIDQQGFAYLPLTDPIELEIDTIPYTVPLSVFVASIRWKGDPK